jgi:hypothetical protein
MSIYLIIMNRHIKTFIQQQFHIDKHIPKLNPENPKNQKGVESLGEGI